MQQFGYGIEQLGEFTNLIKQNSATLANFGGTVSRGAKIFADAAQDVQKSDLGKQLQMLGKTPDEINKGIAGFIQNQNVLGRGQNSIQQDLKKETKDYLLNLDLLSRLTGQDAETIQRKQQEALAVDQYNATQFMLKKRMDAGDEKAAAQYKANERIASTLTGDALKDFVAGVGGDQEAMGRIYQTSSGAAQMMNEGITDAGAFLQTLSKDAGKMQEMIAPAAALGVSFRDMTYGMKDLGEMTAKSADETVQQQEARAKKEQELATKGLDPATKAATELRISQQQQRDASQNLINAGIVPVTKAMEKLAGVTNAVAQVPGAVAPKTLGGPAGGGQQGGATAGGAGGWLRNALGIGGGGGGAAPSGAGLTGKSLDGVNPNLADALGQAAGEYKQITGQTVEVTSALRDSTKQAELYNAYVTGKSKFPAAPPGTSLHERGLAVDVNQATADKLDSMGLLAKYGLSRPVSGDPVHIQGAYANGGYLSANGIGVVGENGPELVKGPADVTSAQNSASMFSALEQMPDLLNAQLDKLSELVRAMENQSSISSKILQQTQ